MKGVWIPLSAMTMYDQAIVEAGPMAELAFYRSLQMAKLVDEDGQLFGPHCAHVMSKIRRKDDVTRALLEHNLWVPGEGSASVRIRNWGKYNTSQTQRVHNDEAEPQVRKPDRSETYLEPRARVKEERERREEPFRSPSGSDRNGSARAAPRNAGGAARPAPTERQTPVDVAVGDQDDESGTVIGLGELSGPDLAKANIRKTRGTGRPTQFRQPEWQQRRTEGSPFDAAMAEIAKRLPGTDE